MLYKVHIIILVAVMLTSYLGSATDLPLPGSGVCGLGVSDRIYGGNITGLTSYPWAALLVYCREGYDDSYGCAGSLISDRYVLTAAHCISDTVNGLKLTQIRLGEWDLETNPDCIMQMSQEKECNDPPVDIGIEKVIMHKEYKKRIHENDIALIKLNQTVTFTETVQPVCLPLEDATRYMNTAEMTFTAVGWGHTEHENETESYGSRYKLHVELRGVGQSYCNFVYFSIDGYEVPTSQLCTGGETGKDTCYCDSGSGLVSAVEGYSHLFGIVSYGSYQGCGTYNVPGVNTRVTSYLDWIEANMDSNEETVTTKLQELTNGSENGCNILSSLSIIPLLTFFVCFSMRL